MTSDFGHIVNAIRALYRENSYAQALFDWTARRERDASATSVDSVCNRFGWTRGETVALAKALEAAGCGEFIVGRKGQKSRFSWSYSCISLGQAAAGELSDVQVVRDPLPEAEEDMDVANIPAETVPEASSGSLKLTISQAKEALARSLGLMPTNIEITIRA